MFSLQPTHLLIILIVALILFGPKRLPEIGRNLGQALREFRKEVGDGASVRPSSEIKEELTKSGEPPLLVFVSSILGELKEARTAVKDAVDSLPPTIPWLFEEAPASSDSLEASYLQKVESCDLYILLLGKTISEPVLREYNVAQEHNKPCLVFVQKGEHSQGVDAFLQGISSELKWKDFETLNDLKRHVMIAVVAEIVKDYRRYRLSKEQTLGLVLFLQQQDFQDLPQFDLTDFAKDASMRTGESEVRAGETLTKSRAREQGIDSQTRDEDRRTSEKDAKTKDEKQLARVKSAPIDTLFGPALVVSKSGNGQFTTISEAIEDADPGTRILVRPGVYKESLSIHKPVELAGDGVRREIVVESFDVSCIKVWADATIRGLTIHQAGSEAHGVRFCKGRPSLEDCDVSSDGSACIVIENDTANPIIRRCRIYNSRRGNGVFADTTSQGSIEDSEIIGNALSGIEVSSNANLAVRRCKIHDNKQCGIYVYDNGRGTIEDSEIIGNALSGIEVSSNANLAVRRCKIHSSKQGGGVFVHDGGKGLFENCEIYRNALTGVESARGGSPVIQQCRINKNKQTGVFVHDNGSGKIVNCDLTGNGGHGAFNIGFLCWVQRSSNKEN